MRARVVVTVRMASPAEAEDVAARAGGRARGRDVRFVAEGGSAGAVREQADAFLASAARRPPAPGRR